MRQIHEIQPYRLWIGAIEDVRDLRAALAAGVTAVVDVAGVDPAVSIPPPLLYCRFPLVDEPGNPQWLLRLAVSTTALLLGEQRPIMVACHQGMSRSVSVAAAALAAAQGNCPDACLEAVKRKASTMVSPGLWEEVKAVLGASVAEHDRITWAPGNPLKDGRLNNLPALVRDFRAGRVARGWRNNERWENRWLDLPVKPLGYYKEFSSGPGDPGALRIVLGQGGEVYVSCNHERRWQEVVGLPAK